MARSMRVLPTEDRQAARSDRRPVYRWQPKPAPTWADLCAGGKRARRWRRYWITDVLDGVGDLAFATAFRFGPVEGCSDLGAHFGRRAGLKVHISGTQVARVALRQLAPRILQDAEDVWLAGMWANIGRTFAEAAVLGPIHKQGRVQVDGLEHLHAVRRAGRPALLVFVHTGNWELLHGAIARAGLPLAYTYQPPPNRVRHWLIKGIRAGQGAEALPPGLPTLRPVLRRLRDGCLIGFAIDEALDDYCYGPSFGRPAFTGGNMALVQRLAHAARAQVIPAYCLRHPGVRFTVRFDRPLFDFADAQTAPLTQAALVAGVARISAYFEPVIANHLQQWYMLHQFGIRPGEQPRLP